MARYVKVKTENSVYVADMETDLLYEKKGGDRYMLSNMNVTQFGKFIPDFDELGEFDEFPGEIITEEYYMKGPG